MLICAVKDYCWREGDDEWRFLFVVEFFNLCRGWRDVMRVQLHFFLLGLCDWNRRSELPVGILAVFLFILVMEV